MRPTNPLIVLARVAFIGIFWSIFFLEGIRVIMLINWHFDIVDARHWKIAWHLWKTGQFVIKDSKEWAFILIIFSFIPLWLTGWAALSLIAWEKLLIKAALWPTRFLNKPVNILKTTAAVKKASIQKKSYKEVRPRSLKLPMDSRAIDVLPQKGPVKLSSSLTSQIKPGITQSSPAPAAKNKNFEHNLFKFDEEEDFSFDIDAFDVEAKAKKEEKDTKTETKPAPNKPKEDNRGKDKAKEPKGKADNSKKPANQSGSGKPTGNSTLDIIKQKGFEVITGATIKNHLVDFIGVGEKEICLCALDKEPGDWLADEERFNDEEPLWFSESSHRISPVRKIDIARHTLQSKLEEMDLHYKIKAYIVVQIGNIINAEDMFEVWKEMDIAITRIDRGSPKELPQFAKALGDADKLNDMDKFEKIKKLVRSI